MAGKDKSAEDIGDDILNDVLADETIELDDESDDDEELVNEDLGGDEDDDQANAGANDDDEDEEAPPPRRQRERSGQQQERNTRSNGVADPFDARARLEDKGGDLYHNGKLIAKAGRERRMFEGFRKMALADRKASDQLAGRMMQLAAGAKELFTRYQALHEQKNALDKAGLSASDQALMVEIATAYKKSPLEGLKLMLTKAQLAGVDIKQLGASGAAFDPNVIVRQLSEHIDRKFKPVDEQARERENQNKIAQEANGFYKRNPEAADFAQSLPGKDQQLAEILAQAKQQAPNLTLDELWERLHYQILRQFGGLPGKQATRLVTDKRRQAQRPIPGKKLRKGQGYTGGESFADIGSDILAQIEAINPNG